MKRYAILLAAVSVHLCLGGIYAWSVFVTPLREAFGYSAAQTQFVFGTYFLVQTILMIFTGPLLDRYGPRPLAVASGVLFATGNLVVAFAGSTFAALWLGYGVLGGLSVGCGYVGPIAAGVRWFPEHRGAICGVGVAGYGAGAIVLAGLAKALFARAVPVLHVFRFVGLLYGAVIVLAGLCLSMPPGARVERAAFPRRRLIGDRRFWQLCVGISCGTVPGLAIIGSLKPIGQSLGAGLPEAIAAQAIGFYAVGNATGRVLWGLVVDRLGGRATVRLSLACVAASALVVAVSGGRPGLFLAAAVFLGLCYGGNFAIYPAQTAGYYGVEVLGTVYALVMVAHGVAGVVGPTVMGLLRDATGSYLPGLGFAFLVALAGLLGYVILGRSRQPAAERA